MTKRKKNGQFRKGPMSEEMKRAISRGKRASFERQKLESSTLAVRPGEQKRCTRCGKMKNVPEDYVMRKSKLRSGEVRRYPAPECKQCAAERSAAWRAEQDQEELKAKQRKWNKRRSKKKRNKYHREHRRMKRVEEGAVVRGPWKKYRGELEQDDTPMVDVAPLVQWLKDKPALPSSHPQYRTVTQLTAGKRKRIKLGTVDRVLVAYDSPEEVTMLYDSGGVSRPVEGVG